MRAEFPLRQVHLRAGKDRENGRLPQNLVSGLGLPPPQREEHSGGPKIKKLISLLIVVATAGVVAAACSEGASDLGPGPISGVGPGISIDEVFITDLKGPLLINGLLHIENGQVRLCEALAESFPPQCGGRFLVVKGLDLLKMDGLTREGSVTWSEQSVQILGTVEGEQLTVAGTVR